MPDSPSNVRDFSGEKLGNYELSSRLTAGGMAEIYLARTHGTGEQVVVKMLRPRFAQDPTFVRMFMDEARLAAQLEHPNIGRVRDIGEQGGRCFIAMEHLHGHDARELLEHAIGHGRRIPLAHALAVVRQVAAGLHYAHEKRDDSGRALHIVHRDVSPSNIFITYEGAVKLVDFGLARAASHHSQSAAGTVHGKSAYMSPEQCKGQKLDRRSDIFSLGVVLHELTTSRRLFRSDPGESHRVVMDRIVSGEVPAPTTVIPDYPARLEAIVMRALAGDPHKRYATARALLADIDALVKGTRMASSNAELAAYLREVFGAPEPESGESADDFDASAFDDEEVATTLYSGDIDNVEDVWSSARAPSSPPVDDKSSRPSLRRLALPLQAEDSDVFHTPLMAQLAADPVPGELAERVDTSRADSEDHEIIIVEDEDDQEPQEVPPLSPRDMPQEFIDTAARASLAARADTMNLPDPPAVNQPRWWLVALLFLLIRATVAGIILLLRSA